MLATLQQGTHFVPNASACPMKKSLLIFDFDGTIADTLIVAMDILNEIGKEYDIPQIDKTQFVTLKQKSVPELMEMAGLSWFQLPRFVKKARAQFREHLDRVHPIADMPETLRALQQAGYRMGILTSNTKEGVTHFLGEHNLQFFDFIHAPRSLFGKGKMIRKILSREALHAEDVVMIGDELRDIEAAHKAGIDAIAVGWGFNSPERLQGAMPHYMAKHPFDLLNLLTPAQGRLIA